MRKLILGLAGASALAFGSTAANAAITVNSCSASLESCTADNTLAPAQSSIAWADSGPLSSPFSVTIDYTNTLAGNYFVSLNTANPAVLFNSLTITPFGGGPAVLSYGGAPTNAIILLPGSFGSGRYLLSFGGTTTNGGNLAGTLSFFQAIPEPGTWGMMLLGFGAMGMLLRRRRRPALAQIA